MSQQLQLALPEPKPAQPEEAPTDLSCTEAPTGGPRTSSSPAGARQAGAVDGADGPHRHRRGPYRQRDNGRLDARTRRVGLLGLSEARAALAATDPSREGDSHAA